MVTYAGYKGIKLMAYVYPCLPFESMAGAWTQGRDPNTLDLSDPLVTKWMIDTMLAFVNKTGAGGTMANPLPHADQPCIAFRVQLGPRHLRAGWGWAIRPVAGVDANPFHAAVALPGHRHGPSADQPSMGAVVPARRVLRGAHRRG